MCLNIYSIICVVVEYLPEHPSTYIRTEYRVIISIYKIALVALINTLLCVICCINAKLLVIITVFKL